MANVFNNTIEAKERKKDGINELTDQNRTVVSHNQKSVTATAGVKNHKANNQLPER